MYDTVKATLHRKNGDLWQDALGAMSLAVILVGTLHLPAVF
ncbi:hypothetical protein [Sagittula salina]|nr:hypothetical protein [Sagittula salina]